jgi:hypothetical protein
MPHRIHGARLPRHTRFSDFDRGTFFIAHSAAQHRFSFPRAMSQFQHWPIKLILQAAILHSLLDVIRYLATVDEYDEAQAIVSILIRY